MYNISDRKNNEEFLMENIFITKIHIDKVRNLKKFNIALSETERKHLVLTGKNGSGKTSLLEEMKDYIEIFLEPVKEYEDGTWGYKEKQGTKKFFNTLSVSFNDVFQLEKLKTYIPSKRMLDMDVPKSIEKIDIKDNPSINENLSRDFLKYIIYLDYQLLRAKNDENKQRLQKWFDRFESMLKDLYNCPGLHLEPIPDDLIFKIKMPGIEMFGLNEMADGYAAIFNIITELMLRMDDGNAVVDMDLPGIAFIDEIEAHLHIGLQKKVFPFLTAMFPNIQFIVSTHSPFVLGSIGDALVFDLEKKRRIEDIAAYSKELIE